MVMGSLKQETEIAIIGAGPGGYVAALRAADLGKEVLLIEERGQRGGVCLLEGCIPSKTLIHAASLLNEAKDAYKMGLRFKDLTMDIGALRKYTDGVVSSLSRGVDGLLKKRGVEVIQGRARFSDSHTLAIEGSDVSTVGFKHCIIATGSSINKLPPAYDLPVWTSADALKLSEIPERLLVVGGGYIGLELGLVYAGLGSHVTVVEFFPRLLLGADPDLVEVMVRASQRRFESVLVESKVIAIEKTSSGFVAKLEHLGQNKNIEVDQVLVAVGRKPNTDDIGLENAGVLVNDQQIIPVAAEGRTSVPHIFAIGDVTPGPMLAHKASREAKVAAEVIAQHPSAFDNRAIPAVVFTDPEIAWTGITEEEAKAQRLPIKVGRFPLSALGRARSLGKTEGLVKIISHAESSLILGVGIVGASASEMIAEGTLAIEMGATIEDLLVTIHPHPTLSEAIMEAAEVVAGTPVHINPLPQ